ncbi:hypothetical protein Dxin01_02750 [Deinococcus xinjiangensis]|uniref:Uncharacterized protein n=1 Tax=Deinococcus xinjiangensis TaxID=457454 RepID=A0ABP9VEE8_9DEIO
MWPLLSLMFLLVVQAPDQPLKTVKVRGVSVSLPTQWQSDTPKTTVAADGQVTIMNFRSITKPTMLGRLRVLEGHAPSPCDSVQAVIELEAERPARKIKILQAPKLINVGNYATCEGRFRAVNDLGVPTITTLITVAKSKQKAAALSFGVVDQAWGAGKRVYDVRRSDMLRTVKSVKFD